MPALGARPHHFLLLFGFSCSGPPSTSPVPAWCIVAPSPGLAPLESVRIVVADSAVSGRFVRQGDAEPPAECAGFRGPAGATTGIGPSVVVTDLAPEADPRDPLDRGEADLLVSRDPRLFGYARNLTAFRVVPLPWDLTYVLVAGGHPDGPNEAERAALASDAVPGDARGATAPFWWLDPAFRCGGATDPPASMVAIRYSSGDPVARSLAARLVALAALPEPPAWLAAIVPQGARADLRTASVGRGDLREPIVVAYPRAAPASCGSERWRPWAIPLVDSRAFVVVRNTVPAFQIMADGSIRFLSGRPR